MYLNRVLFVSLFTLFVLFTFAQKKDSLRYHPNSYKLDLPGAWMKPKMIKTITGILEITIDELKERNFITAGKADLTVRLLIDSLTINNEQTSLPVELSSQPGSGWSYNFSFYYSFLGSLYIIDSLGKPISSLKLVSPDELFHYSKNYRTPQQHVVYEIQYDYDSSGRRIPTGRIPIAGQGPPQIPMHYASSVVTTEFLLAACEKKLFYIRKILKKLN